jgi:hypothetical protein
MLLIIFYTVNKKPLITQKRWRIFTEDNKKLGLKVPSNPLRLTVREMSVEHTHLTLMMEGPNSTTFKKLNPDTGSYTLDYGNFFTTSEVTLYNLIFYIQDPTF